MLCSTFRRTKGDWGGLEAKAMRLPDNAFLRHQPRSINPEQRYAFDAVVYALDAVVLTYQRMVEDGAALASRTETGAGDSHRVNLIASCWSIVDAIHATRQILLSQSDKDAVGPLAARFFELAEPASAMRNQMDHLHQNLRNLSQQRGTRSPLFGSVSFFQADQPVMPSRQITSGRAVVASAGPHLGDQIELDATNPIGREMQGLVGMFDFQAFGKKLKIDDVLRALSALLHAQNGRLEREFNEQVPRLAEQNGVSQEQLRAVGPSGLVIWAEMGFGTPQEA